MANLFIDDCAISAANGMRAVAPGAKGGTRTIKPSNVKIPKIPILVNKAGVPEHTLFLAHDDPVVARAREEDKGHAHGQKGEEGVRHWPWA